MLRAGAHRVLWLRVLQESLAEGVAALLAEIPAGGAIVCESNSARAVIEPGLFLVMRPRGAQAVKASAAQWLPLADRVVEFTGTGWGLAPDQCHFRQGAWFTTFGATAVILAGGQSRRMGQDKSLMQVCGQPLIERIAGQLTPFFPEVLVNSNDAQKYRFLGLPVIADEVPGQGPLMGILSSLKAAGQDRILAIACDIPVADLTFIRELVRSSATADIVMPVSADGRFEPLFAVYRKTVIPRAEAALAEGKRRIVALLPGMAAAHPPMPVGWYCNLNTQEDYAAFGLGLADAAKLHEAVS
jgi:molybdopterin-guanine dinucleotide biosynthesis protein A